MGQPRPFFINFRFFKHTLQLLEQINVKNVYHPVYSAGIWQLPKFQLTSQVFYRMHEQLFEDFSKAFNLKVTLL